MVKYVGLVERLLKPAGQKLKVCRFDGANYVGLAERFRKNDVIHK